MSLEVVEKENEVTEGEELKVYVNLLRGLNSVMDLPGKQFAEKVLDNIKKLNGELKFLDDMAQPSTEFQEFAMEVQMKSQGDPAKIAEFEANNPELVMERTLQLQKVEEGLREKKVIHLKRIPRDQVPHQISARQLLAIEAILY